MRHLAALIGEIATEVVFPVPLVVCASCNCCIAAHTCQLCCKRGSCSPRHGTRLDLETMALTPASALSALLLASSFFTGGAAAAAAAAAALLPGAWLLARPLAAAGAAAAASVAASSSVLPPRSCCSEEPEAEPWDSRLCPLSARLDSSSDSSAASCWRGEVDGGCGAGVAVAVEAMSPIPRCLPRVKGMLLAPGGWRALQGWVGQQGGLWGEVGFAGSPVSRAPLAAAAFRLHGQCRAWHSK